jgi:manganese transport protein
MTDLVPKPMLEAEESSLSLENNLSSPEIINNTKAIIRPKWLRFAGPGALVAVGYIDPGNWATDLVGGSRAGYALLSVVLISSLVAMLLQIMSASLGIATGKDLAQMTRETWPRFALPAWIAAELAIIATDLAEVLGSAIALKLLFSIPLIMGVIFTAFSVLLTLAFDRKDSCLIERIIVFLLFIILCGFVYELALARPVIGQVLHGFIPTTRLVLDPQLLYLSIAIVGATVMPHNLYLHSNLALKRWSGHDKVKMRSLATFDTVVLLSGAMLLNAALVVLAASVFHHAGKMDVSEIAEAYHLLTPLLNSHAAAIVFGVMLLAAGLNSTITATMAGQIVMTGFLHLRMKPWSRRLITRMLALIPALLAIMYFGEQCTANLLIGSQVFLSLQLPLAMFPLLILTSNSRLMGKLVNRVWIQWLGWISAAVIVMANVILIAEYVRF